MPDIDAELDALQAAYQDKVERWIEAIRAEAKLAAVPHNVAAIDTWEAAAFRESGMRDDVKAAKAAYEDALRTKHFGF